TGDTRRLECRRAALVWVRVISFSVEVRMVSVRRCVAWAAVVGVAMVARPALAADQIDNPRYKVWSNFKVGSSETLTGSMDMGGMQMQNEMKETLSELTPEQA